MIYELIRYRLETNLLYFTYLAFYSILKNKLLIEVKELLKFDDDFSGDEVEENGSDFELEI